MPTAEQVAKWADDFEEGYPEVLADRLRWFHDRMGVGQDRLLRLIGIPPAEVKELAEGRGVDWKWVAEQYGDGASWAEEMLLQAVAFFDYNWEGLRDHIRQPLRAEYEIGQPGKLVPLRKLRPAQQDNALLTLIAEGSPRVIPVLIVFLSPDPRRTRTRRKPQR
jgi:hypothetical protein